METRLSAALIATTLIAIAACSGGPTAPAAPSSSPSSELAGVSAQAMSASPVAPKGGTADRATAKEPAAPTIFFISGACADGPEAVPQHASIGGTGFTANSEVGLVMSANVNGWTKRTGRCAGSVFEVGEPFVLPPTFAVADANGDFTVTVTGAECWVEALDLTSCETSNALDMTGQ